jgi:hypothetical protein
MVSGPASAPESVMEPELPEAEEATTVPPSVSFVMRPRLSYWRAMVTAAVEEPLGMPRLAVVMWPKGS